jgi:hypothetical protein
VFFSLEPITSIEKDVLSILRAHSSGLTPIKVRSCIQIRKKMDLSGYSKLVTSIHTTLRRIVGEEVEQLTNEKKANAWRIKQGTATKAPATANVFRLNRNRATSEG